MCKDTAEGAFGTRTPFAHAQYPYPSGPVMVQIHWNSCSLDWPLGPCSYLTLPTSSHEHEIIEHEIIEHEIIEHETKDLTAMGMLCSRL